MTSIEFMESYCDFSDPKWVWIMTGISRNKDNDDSGVRFIRRLIVAKPSEIAECYNEIKLLANNKNTTYRIYISLNARDVVKTSFEFQKTMIDIGYGLARGLEDHISMSKKIGSIWKTELAQIQNRGTKRVLLDIDGANSIQYSQLLAYIMECYVMESETLPKAKTKIYAHRSTPNGYHIVLDAFDTRELIAYCKWKDIKADLHRDSMVFVEQFSNNA